MRTIFIIILLLCFAGCKTKENVVTKTKSTTSIYLEINRDKMTSEPAKLIK